MTAESVRHREVEVWLATRHLERAEQMLASLASAAPGERDGMISIYLREIEIARKVATESAERRAARFAGVAS